MQYGERVTGPPIDRMSPRTYRDSKRRVVDRNSAQWEQKCLLGKLNTDKEPLSPEDIAAIKGTGSLYDDSGVLGVTMLNNWKVRCPSPISTSLFQQNMPSSNVLYSKSPGNGEFSCESKQSENKLDVKDGNINGNCAQTTAKSYEPFNKASLTSLGENISYESNIRLPLDETVSVVKLDDEDRFGGDDDYMDNFQLFRQAYRQWRIDGKASK